MDKKAAASAAGTAGTTARKPGWYLDGPASAAELARGGKSGVWQWWDGAGWKAPEPGDEKAASKAVGGRVAGWVMGGAVVLVFLVIVGQAIVNGVG